MGRGGRTTSEAASQENVQLFVTVGRGLGEVAESEIRTQVRGCQDVSSVEGKIFFAVNLPSIRRNGGAVRDPGLAVGAHLMWRDSLRAVREDLAGLRTVERVFLRLRPRSIGGVGARHQVKAGGGDGDAARNSHHLAEESATDTDGLVAMLSRACVHPRKRPRERFIPPGQSEGAGGAGGLQEAAGEGGTDMDDAGRDEEGCVATSASPSATSATPAASRKRRGCDFRRGEVESDQGEEEGACPEPRRDSVVDGCRHEPLLALVAQVLVALISPASARPACSLPLPRGRVQAGSSPARTFTLVRRLLRRV